MTFISTGNLKISGLINWNLIYFGFFCGFCGFSAAQNMISSRKCILLYVWRGCCGLLLISTNIYQISSSPPRSPKHSKGLYSRGDCLVVNNRYAKVYKGCNYDIIERLRYEQNENRVGVWDTLSVEHVDCADGGRAAHRWGCPSVRWMAFGVAMIMEMIWNVDTSWAWTY